MYWAEQKRHNLRKILILKQRKKTFTIQTKTSKTATTVTCNSVITTTYTTLSVYSTCRRRTRFILVFAGIGKNGLLRHSKQSRSWKFLSKIYLKICYRFVTNIITINCSVVTAPEIIVSSVVVSGISSVVNRWFCFIKLMIKSATSHNKSQNANDSANDNGSLFLGR